MLMAPSLLIFLLFLCLNSTTNAQSNSEKQILLEFKRSLLIPPNGFESWTPSNPHCEFSGIVCNSDGNVTEIDLVGKGISGTLTFSYICQLTQLSKLALASNNLYGDLTADIGGCSSLQHLNLAGNKLTGEIPDLSPLFKLKALNLSANDFTGPFPGYFLGNLTDLVYLHLGDNPFYRSPFPVELLRLTKLSWLYLSNCSIKGEIPPGIGNLKKLVNLELADNYLDGSIPSEITRLTKLWQLELYDNSLTGTLPSGFGNLNNLVFFDASHNNLEGNLSEIRSLTKLVSLQLFENNFSGEVPVEVGEFRKLVNLSLYTNQLTGELPPKLGSWAEFNFIDVSTNSFTGPIPPYMCNKGTMKKLLMLENKFTGAIPETYGNCTSLIRFRVSNNSLSGVVPPGIWSLPNVNIIDLAINSFNGSIGPGIGSAKSLTQLNVNSNRFSGEIPVEIAGAKELVTLDARSNDLSGELPGIIGDLKRLNSLLLAGNRISGSIPTSLGVCSSLNEINLADNSLSGSIPTSLGQLEVLNSLNLSGNLFSGEIPPSLSSLRLSSLDLSHNQLTGRVPSAIAIDAYSESFVGNPDLCSDKVAFLNPCRNTSKPSANRIRTILSIVLVLLGLVFFSAACLHYHYNLRRKSRKPVFSRDSWDMKSFHVLTFDEEDIVSGVSDENLIGKGGSGRVYKVDLKGGNTVAVKHIWKYPVSSREFEAEVGTLSSIRHVNVVKLYCSITSEDSSLLVYEYLPNGSLWEMLHGTCGEKGADEYCLDWDARYEIAVGAAKGLDYLHHGCERPILHRDVKSSNILLDEGFQPRIADFGLAKIMQCVPGKDVDSTRVVAGTHGYIAPEYGYTYKVNEKSDVYSFGVVLMELVTGRRPIEPEFGENKDIVHWVHNKMAYRDDMFSLLDSSIPTECEEEALKVLKVGVLCTVRLPSLRPTMRTVVQMLEEVGRWRSPMVVSEDEKDQKQVIAYVLPTKVENSK